MQSERKQCKQVENKVQFNMLMNVVLLCSGTIVVMFLANQHGSALLSWFLRVFVISCFCLMLLLEWRHTTNHSKNLGDNNSTVNCPRQDEAEKRGT